MPRVGLGTFRAKGHDVQQAVLEALECGLRHIDTASIYKARNARKGFWGTHPPARPRPRTAARRAACVEEGALPLGRRGLAGEC